MKTKLIIATLFYIVGLARIIDWLIFCYQNTALIKDNYQTFISIYLNRFPDFIKPIFSARPEPAAMISVVLFTIAGLFFWKSNPKFLKVLAITAFVFAFWNLFSLM